MTRNIEQVLDKCLEKASHTEDIEVILSQYPQQSDQLRPLLETAAVAHRHYDAVPEPPPGKLAAGRERVLAEAARYRKQAAVVPARPGKPVTTQRRFALKFATALLAAALILVSVGTGVAWAAQDSLPGDTLYPAKLTIEDLRLSLAPDPATGTSLALQFGEERVQELQALTESGQPIPESTVARMQNLFGYALQEAYQAPPEEASGLLEQIALRTKAQAQILERLQAQGEGDQFRLQQAWQSCLQIHEAAQTRMERPPSSPPTPPADKPTGKPAATPGKPDTAGPTGEPVQEQEREQERNKEGEGEQEQEQEQNQNQEQEQEQEQLQQQQQTQPTPSMDPGPHGTPGPHKDEQEKPKEPGGKGEGAPEPKKPKGH